MARWTFNTPGQWVTGGVELAILRTNQGMHPEVMQVAPLTVRRDVQAFKGLGLLV